MTGGDMDTPREEQGGTGRGDGQGAAVRTDRVVALAAGLIAGIVYFLTMARTVSFWDSGEYIACSWIAGIPHPPCVPLFVLLGRFFAVGLPFIPSVASRINLMCVLAGGLSMGILARLVQRWLTRMRFGPSFYRPVSVAAALLAGLSFTVWQNNNATETYALSQLLAVVILWVVDLWIVRMDRGLPGDRLLYLALYLLTLAVAVHLAALIALPGIAIIYLLYALKRRTTLWRSPRFLFTALGLMVLAFSVHLYMPLRAVQRPEINETDPSHWRSFRDALARKQYGAVSPLDRKGPVADQVRQYFYYLSWQSGRPSSWRAALGDAGDPVFLAFRFLLTALAIWGAVLTWSRNRRVMLLVGSIFLMASAFFIFYLNFKTGPIATPTGEVRDRDYFYADSFALWGVFGAIGAGALLRKAFRRDSAAWAALVLPGISLAMNYHECDRSRDFVAHDYGVNLLESCPDGAVLITNGDNDTFPLWFAQSVLGVRRDVIVSNLSLMNTDWYIHQLLDRDPLLLPFGELGLVDSLRPVFIWGPHFFHVDQEGMPSLSGTDSEILRSVFDQAWPWAVSHGSFTVAVPYEGRGMQGSLGMQDLVLLSMIGERPVHGRQVYLAGTVSEDSRVYLTDYLEMEGIAFRVTEGPTRRAAVPATGWRLMESFSYSGFDDPSIYKDDQAIQLARNYVSAWHRMAYQHLAEGQADSVALALSRSRDLFREMPDEWMQILASHTLLEARLLDGMEGPGAASALLSARADTLYSYASGSGDSRLASTALALRQLASDFQREGQFRSFADSMLPGTPASTWLLLEVDLSFGNYISAWDRMNGLEAEFPGDPMTALIRSDLETYMSSTSLEDRYDISTSALASTVRLADSVSTAGAVDETVRFLAQGRTSSAAALCSVLGSLAGDEEGGDLLSELAADIARDPSLAVDAASWFTLQSARAPHEETAWLAARSGHPALCYLALYRAGGCETAMEALLGDPDGYAGNLPDPGSGRGVTEWVNRLAAGTPAP